MADSDRSTLFPAMDRCPGCGATGLTAMAPVDAVVFYCDACSACWSVQLGFVVALDPKECTGPSSGPAAGRPAG